LSTAEGAASSEQIGPALTDRGAIEVATHFGAVHQPEARAAGSNIAAIGPDHSLVAMARYLNNRAGIRRS
jgi:hypothetical protein